MADLATYSLNYSLESEQLESFNVENPFGIDDGGVFCHCSLQSHNPIYYEDGEDSEEEEEVEDEFLNNFDPFHWPELGKHMTSELNMEENPSADFLDQERIFSFPEEDNEGKKFECEADSKPQTYAAVVQKTLKFKLDDNTIHRHNGCSVQKHENETVLYGNTQDGNNYSVVFGDQKYILKWNFVDIPSQNIEATDRNEIDYLTEIYCNFMQSSYEKLPVCVQGKEVIDFSSLLMLVGSRIEVHDVDGVAQLYYCLNKDWTEEDSIIAHKSYLPPYCFMRENEGIEGEEDDGDAEVLSAKAQAVCTYGFDLNTALTISKDLWGWKRPRMAYTQMFNSLESSHI